jgi:hypothetical protein
MRFSKDFIKLSEYFGPDDYDRNIDFEENIHHNSSPMRAVKSSKPSHSNEKEDKNSQIENETKKISKLILVYNNRFTNCF